MIDLGTLRSLQAVESEGSIIGAASALGFTPSAVSQQIKRLERQAGVPLLERVGRGVVLTTHGRELIDRGGRILGDLEQLEAGLHRATETVAGHFRLAAFSTAMRGLIAPAIQALLNEHPNFTVGLVEREPWDAIELVASGQYEMGVVHTWGDVPIEVPDHLERTSVSADVADVIVHQHHPLAGQASVTPTDLIDEGWIATPEGTICRQWLSRMYNGTGRRPRIVHESMEFESHLALARARLGIALVPRLGRSPLTNDLVALTVSDPVPTRDIVAVHRQTMGRSPAVQAVLEALIAAGAPMLSSIPRIG